MAFTSRGARFLMKNVPDDFEVLKKGQVRMRNFEGIVDLRSWSCSAFLRHEHLLELMTEKDENYNMENDSPKVSNERPTHRNMSLIEGPCEVCLEVARSQYGESRLNPMHFRSDGDQEVNSGSNSIPRDIQDQLLKLSQENEFLKSELRNYRSQERQNQEEIKIVKRSMPGNMSDVQQQSRQRTDIHIKRTRPKYPVDRCLCFRK